LSLSEGATQTTSCPVMPMNIYALHWSPECEAGTPQKRLRVQKLKARELDDSCDNH
jgi:hypothetical protein